MKNIIFILFLLLLSSKFVRAQENVLWKFESKARIYSSPVIDENTVIFSRSDGKMYAVKII